MATDYVMIGHTDVDGVITDGHKLDVLAWTPTVRTPVEVDEGTLGGDASMSFGASKNVWKFTVIVPYGSPVSGYADLIDVKGWYAAITNAGNLFKFQGLANATVYDVLLLNKAEFAPKPLSATLYDAASLYSVDIELIEQ